MGVRSSPPSPGQRWWLHALLLVLTLLTTTIVGARLDANFAANRPAFVIDEDFAYFLTIWHEPRLLLAGLPFSLSLLDRKSTRLNSSHIPLSRMPSSA